MLASIYRHLPTRLRQVAKRAFAASGHRGSVLDGFRARNLAMGRKRLSIVGPILERRLALSAVSLRGKACMEFGSGFMPSELLYYWSLGARRLIAVDYNRIARFEYLSLTVGKDPKYSAFDAELIDYRAPFDMS